MLTFGSLQLLKQGDKKIFEHIYLYCLAFSVCEIHFSYQTFLVYRKNCGIRSNKDILLMD